MVDIIRHSDLIFLSSAKKLEIISFFKADQYKNR